MLIIENINIAALWHFYDWGLYCRASHGESYDRATVCANVGCRTLDRWLWGKLVSSFRFSTNTLKFRHGMFSSDRLILDCNSACCLCKSQYIRNVWDRSDTFSNTHLSLTTQLICVRHNDNVRMCRFTLYY